MNIDFFLSGGASNADPDLSLGGVMSSVQIDFGTVLDNLYNDVSSSESINGLIDFRCFYIKNTTSDESLHNTIVTIDSQVAGGSAIDLGADLLNDEQLLTITGSPDTSVGSTANVVFNVPGWGVSFQVAYGDDTTTFAAEMQSMMNAQTEFVGVTASALDATTVKVTFSGFPKNHLMPLIDVITNNLGGGALINITKLQDGSPIQITAEVIATDIVTPGVTLGLTTLSLGTLRHGEYVPIWTRRTTPPASLSLLEDNFILRITGDFP